MPGCIIESLYRDIAKRPLVEVLNRDLVKRTGVLILLIFFLRELEQRSYLEISYRDLAWRSLLDTLDRFSAKGFGTAASTETLSDGDFAHNLRQRSSRIYPGNPRYLCLSCFCNTVWGLLPGYLLFLWLVQWNPYMGSMDPFPVLLW